MPNHVIPENLITDSPRYIGSKKNLLDFILTNIVKIPGVETAWDAFSGTTIISQALAQCGYRVIASDNSVWSACFGKCYLINNMKPEYYNMLLYELNHVEPKEGWFTRHYYHLKKKPWRKHNLMKLDGVREALADWKLPDVEESVLLTSLILGLNKCDNTLGHQSSYLKRFCFKTRFKLRLKMPHLLDNSEQKHLVYKSDIFDLLPFVSADLAYLDPPYGSNNVKAPSSRVRYPAYYHLWTSIILNDHPKLFGVAGRRVDSSDIVNKSPFEAVRKEVFMEAFDRLIRDIQAKYVLVSYSNNGRITIDDVMDIMSSYGNVVSIQSVTYKVNPMANMTSGKEYVNENLRDNKEFLILLNKG